MNGIHDMGGMHGFGAVPDDDSQFHADWERRIYGIDKLLKSEGVYNIDEKRHAIERMAPKHYLDTYFERWLAAAETLLAEKGHLDPAELDARVDEGAGVPADPADADAIRERAMDIFHADADYTGEPQEPQFEADDEVVVKNRHPAGHTRCPRYVRGKRGTVHDHHGTHVYPDENAHGEETARPLYSVRFDGAELWDGDTSAGAVYIDLWEPYLRTPE